LGFSFFQDPELAGVEDFDHMAKGGPSTADVILPFKTVHVAPHSFLPAALERVHDGAQFDRGSAEDNPDVNRAPR